MAFINSLSVAGTYDGDKVLCDSVIALSLYSIEHFLRLLPQRWETKQLKNSEQQNCVTQLRLYT